MGLKAFPTFHTLEEAAAATPQFMRPSAMPYAVWYEGLLSGVECDAIIDRMNQIEPYSNSECGALTRECHSDPVLNTIEATARGINALYWNYDLDPGQHSWYQSYEKGGKYQSHMDGAPGQTRKLTAVALLSPQESYSGGELRLVVPPKAEWLPRTRGTVVVFEHWLTHEVKPVASGYRKTINMGFWGPPFK